MLLHSLEDAIRLNYIGIGTDIVVSSTYLCIFAKKVVAFDMEDLRKHTMSMENFKDIGEFLLLDEGWSYGIYLSFSAMLLCFEFSKHSPLRHVSGE